MNHKEFTKLGKLLKKWTIEQAICEYRVYSSCDHPRNTYGGCGLNQCPNPKPRKDGKIIFPEGRHRYFWIQERDILFRKFDNILKKKRKEQ